jgi:hypothetical protein
MGHKTLPETYYSNRKACAAGGVNASLAGDKNAA